MRQLPKFNTKNEDPREGQGINLCHKQASQEGIKFTKAKYIVASVRPKFGFGIENRNQGPISVPPVLVSEPRFFFSKTETLFFNFFSFFPTLGGIQVFTSLKINPDLQK